MTPASTGHRGGALSTVVAAGLGVATFLPVGIGYLLLLLLTLHRLINPSRYREWFAGLWRQRTSRWLLGLLGAFVLWHLAVVGLAGVHADTATRLFHLFRVVWVLLLGLTLSSTERRAALLGFLLTALLAAAVVMVHKVWPLPPSPLWDNLLEVTGNNSSQKVIMMACAAGASFWLAIAPGRDPGTRAALLGAWLVLASVVALHAISRNAYLLLLLLPALALLYRFRSWKTTLAAVTAVVALGTLMWHVSPAVPKRVHQASQELQALAERDDFRGSTSVRLRMYQEAVSATLAHPVVGNGVGSWGDHWVRASALHPKMAELRNPHNDYLLIAMETGVPGLLFVAGVLAWFVVASWRARNSPGGVAFILSWTVIITAMVNAPLRDAGLGMAMMWLMAAATTGPWNTAPARDT